VKSRPISHKTVDPNQSVKSRPISHKTVDPNQSVGSRPISQTTVDPNQSVRSRPISQTTVDPRQSQPNSTEIAHIPLECSTCKMGIVGALYKSKNRNARFCEDCVRRGEAPTQYALVKYPDPKNIENTSKGSLSYILNNSCTVCSSEDRGIRYKCLERKDYYMCSNCEKKDNTIHPRLRIPML